MNSEFYLIKDGSLSGIENMARDALLLDYVESLVNKRITFLRFYKWIVPTLSIGRNQEVEKVADVEFCRENGVDIVRRPTGGRAVLHHMEITYSIVSNDLSTFGDALLKVYRNIANSICKGLQNLGIDAEIVSQPEKRTFDGGSIKGEIPCFSSTSRYEIEVKGKKIVGSAQRRLKNSFLQHGSIIFELDVDLQSGAMKVDKSVILNSVTSISEHVDKSISYEEVVEELVKGFEKGGIFEFKSIDFPTDFLDKVPEYAEIFKVAY